MPVKLLTRPVTLTVRRQELDKPVIVEIKTEMRPKLLHMSRIPTSIEYESFKLIVRSTSVTLSGSPSDLWRLEQLFGSTYYEAFLAVTDMYCQLAVPIIPERDARGPQLTLDLAIEGDVAHAIRAGLREHISSITGLEH